MKTVIQTVAATSLFFGLIGATQASIIAKVDIGTSGQKVQSGFTGWSSPSNSIVIGGVTFSHNVEEVETGGVRTAGWTDTGDVTHALGDLARDFIFRTSRIQLTIDGLAAGEYVLTAYHHDARYVQRPVTVTAGGHIFAPFDNSDAFNVQPSTTFAPSSIAKSVFRFKATGGGEVRVSYLDPTGGVAESQAVVINGFELRQGDVNPVPEPSTLAIWSLLGVSGVGLASRRLGKKSDRIHSKS